MKRDNVGMYHNNKILITGGTGTIGQHLVERLLLENPKVIRIFSRDEYKQYEMQQKYSENNNIRYLIGDVRDQQRLNRAMEDIDYVFHLAAMKHVPACEYNPFEAVQTNVIGTQNVIQSAIENKVRKVLFTSTDKAINPSNTYGATKLTAERIISAAEFHKGPKQTIFSSVRFGNVMGSRGSVIPLFKKQILEEQKVTVTNSNMLRYMMTPTQAISLILKANQLAHGGEVFIFKMPVILLSDLVEIIVEELSNRYQIGKINIEEVGLRPGEKMFEELMTDDEARLALETNEMFILPSSFGKESTKYDIDFKLGENISPIKKPIDKTTLRDWLLNEQLL